LNLGVPEVDCMEDRVKVLFHTEKPFTGRIFVKGMVDKSQCVNSFDTNSKSNVQFEIANGECNMRRSRKLGPEHKGVEQSIAIIISFHNTFITKIDRAYRCTCFYMEADKVVTNRFDVSMLPTTDLIDTARMPLCTYTVRRGSLNGAVVTYASVGEQVFHVWHCESDMFSMLVHSCFVDDGNGKEKKPLIDEYGCAIEPTIVPDITYNDANNLAFSEINIFKFADKVTTYFQCAVSTCMKSEGMCVGKTPPRCGNNIQKREEKIDETYDRHRFARHVNKPINKSEQIVDDQNTMDLSTDKIIVLDLDEERPGKESFTASKLMVEVCFFFQKFLTIIVLGGFIC
uniref:ZP domain-containing protein n=1 Tax=Dracunculus medinensis TaxID=318479 RepID=A0A0N4U8M5_DRAME